MDRGFFEQVAWMLGTVLFFTLVILAANWLYGWILGLVKVDDLHDLDVEDDEVLS